MCELTLHLFRGQVSFCVNVINFEAEPLKVNLTVYSAIYANHLRDITLAKLPNKLKNLDQAKMILTLKKKQLHTHLIMMAQKIYPMFFQQGYPTYL